MRKMASPEIGECVGAKYSDRGEKSGDYSHSPTVIKKAFGNQGQKPRSVEAWTGWAGKKKQRWTGIP